MAPATPLAEGAPAPQVIERRGPPGEPGPPGPSFFLAVRESGSTELFGVQPDGFACDPATQFPIQCAFDGWDPGDILAIEFYGQIVSRALPCSFLLQAQVSLDGAATWHGVRGARAHLSEQSFSVSAASSVALDSEPLVRLLVTAYCGTGPDYGPGPEGSSLVLRCVRYRAGTYNALGQLTPPNR